MQKKLITGLAVLVSVVLISYFSLKAVGSAFSKQVVVAVSLKEGNDGVCSINADITNNTNNHLNGAQVDFADFSLTIPAETANSTDAGELIGTGIPPYNSSVVNCKDVAKEIDSNKNNANVSSCSMDGFSEGDCQAMIKLETNFDYDAIESADNLYVQNQNNSVPLPGSYIVNTGFELNVYSSVGPSAPPTSPGNPEDDPVTGDQYPTPIHLASPFENYSPPGNEPTVQYQGISIATVTEVHKDARGVVDWEYITAKLPVYYDASHIGTSESGWVLADDLSKNFVPNVVQRNPIKTGYIADVFGMVSLYDQSGNTVASASQGAQVCVISIGENEGQPQAQVKIIGSGNPNTTYFTNPVFLNLDASGKTCS